MERAQLRHHRADRAQQAAVGSMRTSTLLAASAALRLLLVVWGELQDRLSAVPYTDIDYVVFTDAARFVAQGQSPYQRSTYRYSPLIAYVLLPNVWVHAAWGKVRSCGGPHATHTLQQSRQGARHALATPRTRCSCSSRRRTSGWATRSRGWRASWAPAPAPPPGPPPPGSATPTRSPSPRAAAATCWWPRCCWACWGACSRATACAPPRSTGWPCTCACTQSSTRPAWCSSSPRAPSTRPPPGGCVRAPLHLPHSLACAFIAGTCAARMSRTPTGPLPRARCQRAGQGAGSAGARAAARAVARHGRRLRRLPHARPRARHAVWRAVGRRLLPAGLGVRAGAASTHMGRRGAVLLQAGRRHCRATLGGPRLIAARAHRYTATSLSTRRSCTTWGARTPGARAGAAAC